MAGTEAFILGHEVKSGVKEIRALGMTRAQDTLEMLHQP